MTDARKALGAVVFAFVAASCAASRLLPRVAWSYTTPEQRALQVGEAITLAAIPRLPLPIFSPRDWQAQTEIKIGSETMTLWFGSDTSTWRHDASATGYVSVLQRGDHTVVGRGIQEMDHPDRFDLFIPEDGRRTDNAIKPLVQIRVLTWPKALEEWFDVEFSQGGSSFSRGRARWVIPAGLWTHCRPEAGEPANCDWKWYLNGRPIDMQKDRRGLNNSGMLVIPDFNPDRDSGRYEVVFRYGVPGAGSCEIRAAFDVREGRNRQ